jgi:hypothetical protein
VVEPFIFLPLVLFSYAERFSLQMVAFVFNQELLCERMVKIVSMLKKDRGITSRQRRELLSYEHDCPRAWGGVSSAGQSAVPRASS